MAIPTDYRPGFAKARLLGAEMAERYVNRTLVDDPLADAVIAACQDMPGAVEIQGAAGGRATRPDRGLRHGRAALDCAI